MSKRESNTCATDTLGPFSLPTRSVIVSQWTSMLQIVAVHLRQMGLRYGIIDGTVNPKRRMDLVEEFNTNPKGAQVRLTVSFIHRSNKKKNKFKPSLR